MAGNQQARTPEAQLRLDEALKWFKSAATREPTVEEYWVMQAWVEDELDLLWSAIQSLRHAITVAPDDKVALYNLACALSRTLETSIDAEERKVIIDEALRALSRIPENFVELWAFVEEDRQLDPLREADLAARGLLETRAQSARQMSKEESAGAEEPAPSDAG